MKLGERGEEGTASRRLFGGLRDSSLYTLSVEPREVGVIKLECLWLRHILVSDVVRDQNVARPLVSYLTMLL